MKKYLLIYAALTSLIIAPCCLAATYATGLKFESKTITSISVSWTVASGNTTATYYVITLDDSSNVRIQTVNITDLTSDSMTFNQLLQAKAYTFTLSTHNSDGDVVGSIQTLRVSTEYDTWNTKALIAMGIAGFILLTLIGAKICGSFFNPDKSKEKWKKEVLLVKQRQREEKRRRKSSKGQRIAIDATREENLDEMNLPI